MAIDQKLDDKSQFQKDAVGWAQRWKYEIDSAKKATEKWHVQGDKIVKRFLDERNRKGDSDVRLNLFTSNVQTLRALLYGKTPKVDVSRRFADQADDVARVAAEMLQRLLNTDIESSDDNFEAAVEHALDDKLLPGLGTVRLRYEAEFETPDEVPAKVDEETGKELAPKYTPPEQKIEEEVETDYAYWKDQLWSPCRVFSEVRWWAFKAEMTREELVKRFGAVGKLVSVTSKKSAADKGDDPQSESPWSRASVWEIWDKESEQVFWWVDGFDKILDVKKDPLGLEGFWPFPRPLMANTTTSGLMPRPDFIIAQDLYDEIDLLESRIMLLERAIRVVGVYDKTNDSLKRVFSEADQNEMIPVDNWAMFAEKGGVKGAMDFVPLEMVVSALAECNQEQDRLIAKLYQVTGMSDIMRGQSSQQTTATEQAIKAKFASVRVQSMQDEFARFCSDAQRIKAEIISKHFDVQTIIERSNVLNTEDAVHAQAAAELIKSDFYQYRVEVKPEAVSLTDYAALQQERMTFIQTISMFLEKAMPLTQQMPESLPYLLKMLQWGMAGFKGGSTIEGVLDQAIAASEAASQQPKPPPPPDPRIQVQQMKSQADMQQAQVDMQKSQMDIRGAAAKHQMEMQKMKAQFALNMQSEEAKQRAIALETMNRAIPGGPTR